MGPRMIQLENEEKYLWHCSSEENRVKECGEEMEGLGGAVESPEVSWRRWPAIVVVEVESLHSYYCFMDSHCCFLHFLLHFWKPISEYNFTFRNAMKNAENNSKNASTSQSSISTHPYEIGEAGSSDWPIIRIASFF